MRKSRRLQPRDLVGGGVLLQALLGRVIGGLHQLLPLSDRMNGGPLLLIDLPQLHEPQPHKDPKQLLQNVQCRYYYYYSSGDDRNGPLVISTSWALLALASLPKELEVLDIDHDVLRRWFGEFLWNEDCVPQMFKYITVYTEFT